MDSGPRTAFQLGSYNCVERLRASPIGVEFRAKLYRLGNIEQQFAVTRLHPHLENDARFVTRLAASVKVQAQLEHAAIGKTIALEAGGGDRFLVAEFVHGVDLRQARALLAERRETLTSDLAAAILTDAVQAIAYAHGRTDLLADGVVHAGLSPSTVMLTAEGGVKVTGVGLLRAFQQGSWTADPALEEFLPFLSPECLHGEPPQISSDIWALGALLWELATGATPFGDGTLETIGQAFTDGPGTPARGDTQLLEIARRCLRPVPSERFSSVSELGQALDGWLGERRAQAMSDRVELLKRLVTRPRSTGIFQAVAPGEWASALAPAVTAPRKPERVDAHQGWSPPLPGRGKPTDDDPELEIETVVEIDAELDEEPSVARPRSLPTTDVYDLKELAASIAQPEPIAAPAQPTRPEPIAPPAPPTRPEPIAAPASPIRPEPIAPAPPIRPEPIAAPASPTRPEPIAAPPAPPIREPPPVRLIHAAPAPPATGERPPAILFNAAAVFSSSLNADDALFAPSEADDPAALFAPAPDDAAALFAPGAAMEATESMPSITSLAASAIGDAPPFLRPLTPAMDAAPEPPTRTAPDPAPPLPAPPFAASPSLPPLPFGDAPRSSDQTRADSPSLPALAATPAVRSATPPQRSRAGLIVAIVSGVLVAALGIGLLKWAGGGDDAEHLPADPSNPVALPITPSPPPARSPAVTIKHPPRLDEATLKLARAALDDPAKSAHSPKIDDAKSAHSPKIDDAKSAHSPKIDSAKIAPPAKIDAAAIRTTPATGGAGFSVASEPAGAVLFVDGEPRGVTPQRLDLADGRHRVALAAAGRILWKREIDVAHGGSVSAVLDEAHPAFGRGAGLKVRCKSEARIFVDGADSGVACPNERRIELAPGAHKISIYLLRSGRTVERDVDVPASDDSSTRVYFN